MKAVSLLASVALVALYDNTSAGWKTGADGKIETDASGNPIWVGSDGKESSVQGSTISKLNGEAQRNREALQTAQDKLKAYEGIDPEAARKAIDLTKNIEAGKLIEAGKVDELKAQIAQGYETKLKEKDTLYGQLEQNYHRSMIDAAFAGSSFVKEKIVVPVEMLQATFANNFKVVNGKVIAYDANGKEIYSSKKMGETASFDEAIEQIVDGYTHKDKILAGRNQSGSGGGAGSSARGTGRVVRRSEFNEMEPGKQAAVAAEARAGTVQIVD